MSKTQTQPSSPIEASQTIAVADVLTDHTDHNPAHDLFLAAYCDQNSATFGKLIPSGKKAGMGRTKVETIQRNKPAWFTTGIKKYKRNIMFETAENNVNEFLTMGHTSLIEDKFGNLREVTDATKLKVKAEMTKYVTERLGDGSYTQKNETKHTSLNVNVYQKLTELETLNKPNVINIDTTEGDQRQVGEQGVEDDELVQVDQQEESVGDVQAVADTDILGLKQALEKHNS